MILLQEPASKGKAILEALNSQGKHLFFLDGVVNDKYTDPKTGEVVHPYPSATAEDGTPESKPHLWAHTMACIVEKGKGKAFQDGLGWVPLDYFWLDADGVPNPEKSLWFELRKVYRIS